MEFVNFYRSVGQYNLCSTEKQVQYYFRFGKYEDLAKQYKIDRSFIVDLNEDRMEGWDNEHTTALELAEELRYIYKNYLFNTRLPKVERLIRFLEMINEDNNFERLKYYVTEYQKKLDNLSKKIDEFDATYCQCCGEERNNSQFMGICDKCRDEMLDELNVTKENK